MRLAITADVHLTNEEKHIQRANALRDVIKQSKEQHVERLVIAGDLYDQDSSNPRVFEEIVRESLPLPFQIMILPGNHDPRLSTSLFSSDLPIEVITTPEIRNFNPNQTFMFIPYGSDRSIGAELERAKNSLPDNNFILFSHGDLPDQVKQRNTYEQGLYMPLYRNDLQKFAPRKVFLGHIHIPHSIGNVYYPGSPCGLDISETGPRSFLIYDTEVDQVSKIQIATDFVYYIETLTLVPDGIEFQQISNAVRGWSKKWLSVFPTHARLIVRITVNGYSTNRGVVEESIRAEIRNLNLSMPIEIEKVDTQNCSASEQLPVSEMLAELERRVIDLELDELETMPDKSEILYECLRLIYGGKK